MAFNVTGIGTTYVNENSQDLIAKAVLEANTIKDVTLLPNVKYKEQIKYIEADALIQAYACGTPTTSGTTTITDKDVQVWSLMIYEELCPADLEKTSLQLSLKPGANQEIPFEVQYADLKVKNIQKGIEQMIWANSASGSTNCEGWIHMMEADSDVNDRTFVWSGTSWTAANYSDEVYGMINDLPAEIQLFEDLTLFVPPEVSRRMIQQFVKTGNYHIDYVDRDGNSDWYFPGTNVIVKPKFGLASTNAVILTPASNLIAATDLANEEEKFKLWWSEDDQNVKFLATWKIGVSYYFGEYIVLSNA